MMCATRASQKTMDHFLRDVHEGPDEFDQLWHQVQDLEDASENKELKAQLTTVIQRLERLRDKIHSWISEEDVGEKSTLLEAKQAIEQDMNLFSMWEKEAIAKGNTADQLDLDEQAQLESIWNKRDKIGAHIKELLAENEKKAQAQRLQLDEDLFVDKEFAADIQKALSRLDEDSSPSEESEPLDIDWEEYYKMAGRLEAEEAAAAAAADLDTTAMHPGTGGKEGKYEDSNGGKDDQEELAKEERKSIQAAAAAAALKAQAIAQGNSNVKPLEDDDRPRRSLATPRPAAPSSVGSGSAAAAATAGTLPGQLEPASPVPEPAFSAAQDLCLQALTIVSQYPAIAADQRNICTLLQVSKAFRAALQQSTAGFTDVRFHSSYEQVVNNTKSLKNMITFAEWLSQHPRIIRSLDVSGCQLPSGRDIIDWSVKQSVQELLEHSMQIAATKAGSKFCLWSFASAIPPTAGLLAALPAATLTRLELCNVDNSDWFTAVGQLTRLRELRLNMDAFAHDTSAANSSLQQIGRISDLTQLDLWRVPSNCDLQLLPVQLQELTLLHKRGRFGIPAESVANLEHLTSLQHLALGADKLAVGSSVPPHLRSLKIQASWPAGAVAGLSSLKQVTSVALDGLKSAEYHQKFMMSISSEDLRSLELLPNLMDLSLALSVYWDAELSVADLSWQNMPLHRLNICLQTCERAGILSVMELIGSATNITKLEVCIDGGLWAGEHAPNIFEYLTSMRDLKRLDMCLRDPYLFSQHSVPALVALTTLTSLDLNIDGTDLMRMMYHFFRLC